MLMCGSTGEEGKKNPRATEGIAAIYRMADAFLESKSMWLFTLSRMAFNCKAC